MWLALRSTEDAEKFWLRQLSGGFASHLDDIIDVMTDTVVMEQCGFTCDVAAARGMYLGDIAVEDDFADILGQLVMATVGYRCRRCAHYFAPPFRAFRCLLGPEESAAFVLEFQVAIDLDNKFQVAGGADSETSKSSEALALLEDVCAAVDCGIAIH